MVALYTFDQVKQSLEGIVFDGLHLFNHALLGRKGADLNNDCVCSIDLSIDSQDSLL